MVLPVRQGHASRWDDCLLEVQPQRDIGLILLVTRRHQVCRVDLQHLAILNNPPQEGSWIRFPSPKVDRTLSCQKPFCEIFFVFDRRNFRHVYRGQRESRSTLLRETFLRRDLNVNNGTWGARPHVDCRLLVDPRHRGRCD